MRNVLLVAPLALFLCGNSVAQEKPTIFGLPSKGAVDLTGNSPKLTPAPKPAPTATPSPSPAATTANSTTTAKPTGNGITIELPGDKQWVDTGIDLVEGETLQFKVSGTLKYAGKESTPEGITRNWMDMLKPFPINDGKRGAVVGRVGKDNAARPFLIGTQAERRVPVAGRLFLGINQATSDTGNGSFTVLLERIAANKEELAAKKSKPVTKLTDEQLNSIPIRVGDKEGTPGDRVNFVIVGSEVQVVDNLKRAGWVIVDKTVKDTILKGVLVSLSKQAYVTIPMSELYLFDRSQDYGWAQADPLKVVAARHHFRIWKAPFTVGGRTVWAGAGTHDVGFDKDKRNGKITHKIDSNTDGEREYIGRSMLESGGVSLLDYMTVKTPLTKAKTAHGQEFYSDGRTLIIYMDESDRDETISFSDTFCSVLSQNNPDTGDWGGCENWIDNKGATNAKLGTLSKDYRVLIVPGFMSSCFADSPAFQEGSDVLKNKYGMTVELFAVPNDSSPDNAKKIAAYLKERWGADKRKWILVGYSKGTPDLQEALAKEDGVVGMTAAFVSVAGASGGSPIAEALPAQADRWMNQYKITKSCQGDVSAGFKSLQRSVRQAFLAAYPNPLVPTYSIVASSTKANTSKALAQTWGLLATYDPVQDAQLTRRDAIVPGSTYLGIAKGDHFAVALPFDKSSDSTVRNNMDKTRFPRGALLESLVRFVQADLAKPKP